MSFHALAAVPAATGAAIGVLGVYVLLRNFRSRTARNFFNFALFYLLTATSATLVRVAPNEAGAEFWARLFYFFHVVMVSFLLGAVTGFLRTRFFQRTSAVLGFQVLSFVLGILVAALIGTEGSRIEGGGPPVGFYLEAGTATAAHATVGAAYTALALGLLLKSLPRARGRFRLQILVLSTGIAAPALLGSLTALLRFHFSTFLPPIANFGAFTTALCLYAATFRLRLWVAPAESDAAETAPKYVLEPRAAYLVEERRPAKAYAVFKDLVTHGVAGLLITRQDPATVRKSLDLPQLPVLQLTSAPGDYRVEPREAAELVEHVAKFLRQGGNCVVFIDCFEYLVVEGGFKKAFSAFSTMVDLTLVREGRLLLSISPETLPPDQAALMRKYTQGV